MEASKNYDIVIVGGGISGLLTAIRLHQQNPLARLALIEKNPFWGGRLGAFDAAAGKMRNLYGLQSVSSQMVDFIAKTLMLDAEWESEPSDLDFQPAILSFFSANKLVELNELDVFSRKMAGKLGGNLVAKSWDEVRALFLANEQQGDASGAKAVSKVWTQPRKSGPSVVFEMLCSMVGIPDPWGAPVELVSQRLHQYENGMFQPDWTAIISQAIAMLAKSGLTDMRSGCRLLAARQAEGRWEIETEAGDMGCSTLFVCQNPWDASEWLDDAFIPAPVISSYSKTQPVSLVALWSRRTDEAEALSKQMILVPSEASTIFIDKDQIAVHAPIPFEMSMDAPDVVKTIKRLRRAKRKLEQNFPQITFDAREHLALLPVAWGQSTQAGDRRYVKGLVPARINGQGLFFCGDSYGTEYNDDLNAIRSIVAACERFQEEARQPRPATLPGTPLQQDGLPMTADGPA